LFVEVKRELNKDHLFLERVFHWRRRRRRRRRRNIFFFLFEREVVIRTEWMQQ